MTDDIGQALRSALGEHAVVTDPGVLAAHEVDWTGRFRGRAVALVRPGSAAEVGAALRACAAAGVAVVPQGGNTGLVAGAVPHDAVVLSTARLTSIGEVDAVAGEVTAGRGCDARGASSAPPPRQAWRSGSTSRRAAARRSAA